MNVATCGCLASFILKLVWWVDFGMPFGSEVGFRRPVIILKNDVLNESNLRTVVVLPLTTNTVYAELPNNVFLSKELTGLSKDSVTQPHLLVHVDKNRLLEKVSKLSDSIIEKALDGVIECIRTIQNLSLSVYF